MVFKNGHISRNYMLLKTTACKSPRLRKLIQFQPAKPEIRFTAIQESQIFECSLRALKGSNIWRDAKELFLVDPDPQGVGNGQPQRQVKGRKTWGTSLLGEAWKLCNMSQGIIMEWMLEDGRLWKMTMYQNTKQHSSIGGWFWPFAASLSSDLPSSTQTWQWKIHYHRYSWVIFRVKPPVRSWISQLATFDDTGGYGESSSASRVTLRPSGAGRFPAPSFQSWARRMRPLPATWSSGSLNSSNIIKHHQTSSNIIKHWGL